MIQKERGIPLRIEKLQALLRRLPATHAKYKKVEAELAKSLAGYRGEQSLDYYLSFLPKQDYLIFHDLRLKGEHYHFQIDTLVLSPSFAIILEVKHISGDLLFDRAFHQLIRSGGQGEDVFPDPILQAERQAWQLMEWLQARKYSHVPVHFFVVMTNNQARIASTAEPEHIQRIIRSPQLPAAIAGMELDPRLSKKQLHKLGALLLEQHETHNPDILRQFQLGQEELLTGVQCPACGCLPMERGSKIWTCPKCRHKSSDAHLPALQDYALLISPLVKNKHIREFLHLTSERTTLRLLHSLHLPYTGVYKTRVYELPLQK